MTEEELPRAAATQRAGRAAPSQQPREVQGGAALSGFVTVLTPGAAGAGEGGGAAGASQGGCMGAAHPSPSAVLPLSATV